MADNVQVIVNARFTLEFPDSTPLDKIRDDMSKFIHEYGLRYFLEDNDFETEGYDLAVRKYDGKTQQTVGE